jgi:hypothetical protein
MMQNMWFMTIALFRFRATKIGYARVSTDAHETQASAILRSGDYTRVQVAEKPQVSRYTLWRGLSHETVK